MRWCVNNCICRFLYRHLPAVVLVVVLLLSANQVIHFAKDKSSPICYKIVSPFASKPGGVGVTRSSGGSGAGFTLNRIRGGGDNETETDYILPNVEWTQARYDERRMVRSRHPRHIKTWQQLVCKYITTWKRVKTMFSLKVMQTIALKQQNIN